MKNKIVVAILLFLFISAISGCGTVTRAVEVRDDKPIEPNNGVLVVGLETDWEGNRNPLKASVELLYTGDNESGFGHKSLTFKLKKYYAVISLPANRYYFFWLRLGAFSADIDKSSDFLIEQNTITYIGDITALVGKDRPTGTAKIKVEDNTAMVNDFLTKSYPNLINAHPMKTKLLNLKWVQGKSNK